MPPRYARLGSRGSGAAAAALQAAKGGGEATDGAPPPGRLQRAHSAAHRLQQLEKQEAAKLVLGGVYNPPGGSQARKDIEVNYFLNSPDAETIEAERRYIQDKARRNMQDYLRRMHHANQALHAKQSRG